MRVSLQHQHAVARQLAAALLGAAPNEASLTEAAITHLGSRSPTACRRLIGELLQLPSRPSPPDGLANALLLCPSFERAARRQLTAPWLWKPSLAPAVFAPAPRFADLAIPQLATPGELADWLGISLPHLDWYAGTRRPHDPTMIPVLQHYTYAFIPKTRGPPRLIECPKPRLKTMQRRILDEILVPLPVHPSAHGFVRGRSALTGAQVHTGEAMVLAADLVQFFPSTPLGRVHAVFRSLGYPWAVARALTGLVSTAVPETVFRRAGLGDAHSFEIRKRYASRHLPQGAPTSPALANACAFGLDQRLAGLARVCGAAYTRYADDLTFSGGAEFARRVEGLLRVATQIAGEEGYRIHPAKTRRMPASARQVVTGIVVNEHLNIARGDYDALKATLHNCVRQGPAGQNRAGIMDFRAHLDGRVGWVEQVSPQRGAKLRRLFERIAW